MTFKIWQLLKIIKFGRSNDYRKKERQDFKQISKKKKVQNFAHRKKTA